ncbi:uncharacterized protein LOC111072195 [Drosophila obscura]|uniref:uncharacterized protein LOC111072195 n=1 Tax=Drosophila obscura TaxID=7282 RepID=UPI001BB2446D|nr:uncharacterized protein LOC111072195 [Drosophila obscura]
MSTLPFLLSVADELDNIHTQSYLDDFGLGFHPHRQYYRSPTIQLSLPASAEWTGRGGGGGGGAWDQGRHSRYRSYKFYDESQNNFAEEEQPEEEEEAAAYHAHHEHQELPESVQLHPETSVAALAGKAKGQPQPQPPVSQCQLATARRGLGMVISKSHDVGVGGLGLNLRAGEEEDDENIDRTVRMYNLSKKCCKNYYRHALETGPGASGQRIKCSNLRSESHQSSSSSEESLRKMPSPIEFLTCFLVKKSRTPKCGHSGHSACTGQQLRKS